MIAAPDPSTREPRSVIVIEDDPILDTLLGRTPHDAIVLGDGRADGDGLALLRALRDRGIEAPVVVLRPRTELRVGDLVVHRLARRAFVRGVELTLTPLELALVEFLVLHVGRTVTRGDLLREVWHVEHAGSNVVDAHVARLRAKLVASDGGPRIITERGVGFRLEPRPGTR